MMHSDLVDIGWTEDHWNRITTVVTEEALRARVAAQLLPVTGPVDASTVAVPNYSLIPSRNPLSPPAQRLAVNSDPDLYLTGIAVNVHLRSVEAADPELNAALTMFRRAANLVARIEDALVFNGPLSPPIGMPPQAVFTLTGRLPAQGIFRPWPGKRRYFTPIASPSTPGVSIVDAVISAIDRLDLRGQLGPYTCILGDQLFEEICTPTNSMVLPRDRVLPFLQGPLLRSSAVPGNWGAVIASSGNPVELVVASDIGVRFLQATLEPRLVFRVSERIALRVHQDEAIQLLFE